MIRLATSPHITYIRLDEYVSRCEDNHYYYVSRHGEVVTCKIAGVNRIVWSIHDFDEWENTFWYD